MFNGTAYLSFLSIFLVYIVILEQRRRRRKARRRMRIRKRAEKNLIMNENGGSNKMAAKMIEENIGKKVNIYVDGDMGITGTIIGVEDNWIKLDTKRKVNLYNIDMVTKIEVFKDKADGQ